MAELTRESNYISLVKQVDFGGRSLLNRNSDGHYRFAHQSFQEFLVIQALPEMGWDFPSCSEMMARFMSGVELEDIDFSCAVIRNADLRNVSLSNCSFSKSSLIGTDFSNGHLYRGKFKESDCCSTNFVKADLSFSDFSNSKCNGTDFSNATMLDSLHHSIDAGPLGDWVKVETKEGDPETSARPDGVIIFDQFYTKKNLVFDPSYSTLFKMSKLDGSSFHLANLAWTMFRGASLKGVEFHKCCLRYASFEDAILTDAKFIDCDLRNTNFSGAFLENTRFNEATQVTSANVSQVINAPSEFLKWALGKGAKLL
ncbi:MAG: pentapeptide repeat-containing protein [Acidobacteriota bacterium]|nr:pentapeptide repeat-containing protein [Acidobacteriota bacterium]